jgi:hypothetical protein
LQSGQTQNHSHRWREEQGTAERINAHRQPIHAKNNSGIFMRINKRCRYPSHAEEPQGNSSIERSLAVPPSRIGNPGKWRLQAQEEKWRTKQKRLTGSPVNLE